MANLEWGPSTIHLVVFPMCTRIQVDNTLKHCARFARREKKPRQFEGFVGEHCKGGKIKVDLRFDKQLKNSEERLRTRCHLGPCLECSA